MKHRIVSFTALHLLTLVAVKEEGIQIDIVVIENMDLTKFRESFLAFCYDFLIFLPCTSRIRSWPNHATQVTINSSVPHLLYIPHLNTLLLFPCYRLEEAEFLIDKLKLLIGM